MSDSSKGYQFTLSGNTVTAVYEVEHGRVKFERMDSDETWSFDGTNVIKTEWDDGRLETTTYSDANGDGLFFKASKTYTGTSSYSGRDDHGSDGNDSDDHNNDHGNWGDSTPSLDAQLYGEEGYQFDIDVNGVVTAVYEVEHGRVEAERMDWNETWAFDGLDVIQTETKFGKVETTVYTDANQDGVFQKGFELEVGGDNLILKTKTQWNGEIDFSVFRDDDNDGLWTEIADGETLDAYVSMDGEVDLVGIVDAGLLQAADVLIA